MHNVVSLIGCCFCSTIFGCGYLKKKIMVICLSISDVCSYVGMSFCVIYFIHFVYIILFTLFYIYIILSFIIFYSNIYLNNLTLYCSLNYNDLLIQIRHGHILWSQLYTYNTCKYL